MSASYSSPRPRSGEFIKLEDNIRRIIAPNPSAMTFWGTNTFVLGQGNVAVIDPGPNEPLHMKALLDGLEKHERITEILVTHAHLDHSPLARTLSQHTGAPVIAYSHATGGRSAIMQDLVARGFSSGGEGIDAQFSPDICVNDGECFDAGGLEIEAIWTPGHFANHLSFALQDTVFTGDHVMAWSSSLISPPDGDLTAFMQSCEKLAARNDKIYYPAHGPEIKDPAARVRWLIAHRKSREQDILSQLSTTEPCCVPTLTRKIYHDLNPNLHFAAQRNVLAHLIDLLGRKVIKADREISTNTKYLKIIPKNH